MRGEGSVDEAALRSSKLRVGPPQCRSRDAAQLVTARVGGDAEVDQCGRLVGSARPYPRRSVHRHSQSPVQVAVTKLPHEVLVHKVWNIGGTSGQRHGSPTHMAQYLL